MKINQAIECLLQGKKIRKRHWKRRGDYFVLDGFGTLIDRDKEPVSLNFLDNSEEWESFTTKKVYLWRVRYETGELWRVESALLSREEAIKKFEFYEIEIFAGPFEVEQCKK